MVFQFVKGTVQFVYAPASPVEKVFLAGSFNNWEPVAMTRQSEGEFVRNLKLPPGTYEYKFIIDGQWRHDLDHGNTIGNSAGTLNSVVVVE